MWPTRQLDSCQALKLHGLVESMSWPNYRGSHIGSTTKDSEISSLTLECHRLSPHSTRLSKEIFNSLAIVGTPLGSIMEAIQFVCIVNWELVHGYVLCSASATSVSSLLEIGRLSSLVIA